MNTEIAGLAWSFHVSPDSCDNPMHYENYLRLSALAEQKDGQAVTHVMIDDDANCIAGFVALRATSLVSTLEDGKLSVNPALEIAELAVDQSYEGEGVGTTLVKLALAYADLIREGTAGIKFVMLCSDPKSVGFYEKLGFSHVSDLYKVLNDGWNNHCEPMYRRLPEL